jgi:hypothetical protein
MERSYREMNSVYAIGISAKQTYELYSNSMSLIPAIYSLVSSAIKQSQKQQQQQQEEEDPNSTAVDTTNVLHSMYESEVDYLCSVNILMGFFNRADFFWLSILMDIAQTVDNTCVVLLHDHSQSYEELARRQKAIYEIGQIYMEYSGD